MASLRYGRALGLAGLLAAALVTGGCTGHRFLTEAEGDTRSLAFGFIDMSEAPSNLNYFNLKQVRPKTDKPYRQMRLDGTGMFYIENLPVGSYQVSDFGGPCRRFLLFCFHSADFYEYTFPEHGRNETAARITRPGIYFLGAYKYEPVKTSWFKPDQFDIARIESPTEAELLERLLPYATGTQWESIVRSRLARLK